LEKTLKITSLNVENFRAIHQVRMENIGDMVMIAGPNGCGKSCILDSIRLLKSVYGGYSPNEWQQWLGEFKIDFQRNPHQMVTLLRDKSRSSITEVTFELDKNEISFLRGKARQLVEDTVWKSVVPGMNDSALNPRGALAAELRSHKSVVDQQTNNLLPEFTRLLDDNSYLGRLEISPDGKPKTTNNLLLEIVFSLYKPKHLGLIDYHGSHRNYGRERLGGINLNFESAGEQHKQHALYNHANKYNNIKKEMAADYVRDALREKSGIYLEGSRSSLALTLQELFNTFFPGKKFNGPIPTSDGNLDFPVILDGGGTHDIDELSSGEKEVLFGYLRLRNSAPRYSIILLDEPELHLNPALVRGLPQFYKQHLGSDLSNQIWLVTHSDAFLRESVGAPGIEVYHMQYYQGGDLDNQIHEVKADEEAEAVILELVGDMAAYRPGAKVVFFEGEDSEFDLRMVSTLFPEAEKSMNFVSGGNRNRVERLHKVLDETVQAGKIPAKIYSIVDKDSGQEVNGTGYRRHYSWDVYHIENYLLSPKYILEAMRQIGQYHDALPNETTIEEKLKEIARGNISVLVVHSMREKIGKELITGIQLNANPNTDDLGAELHKVTVRSAERINTKIDGDLSILKIRSDVNKQIELLEQSLDSEEWKKHFRGRDILKKFSGEYCTGIRYEMFRNLIINTMLNDGFQPEGMKKVIDQVMNE
jgi:predicted ATPase